MRATLLDDCLTRLVVGVFNLHGVAIEHHGKRTQGKKGFKDIRKFRSVGCVRDTTTVDSKEHLIIGLHDAFGERCFVPAMLFEKRMRIAYNELFVRNGIDLAQFRLVDPIRPVTRARSNRLYPDTALPAEKVELRPLIPYSLNIEPAIKQRAREIHFPETLKEMMFRIFTEVRVSKWAVCWPQRFSEIASEPPACTIADIHVA